MRNRVFHKGWYYMGLLSDCDLLRMMYGFGPSVGKDCGCRCKRFIDAIWPRKRKMLIRLTDRNIEKRTRRRDGVVSLSLSLWWKRAWNVSHNKIKESRLWSQSEAGSEILHFRWNLHLAVRLVRCSNSSESAICSWGYIGTFSISLHNEQTSPLRQMKIPGCRLIIWYTSSLN
jgi:hypothetical protein